MTDFDPDSAETRRIAQSIGVGTKAMKDASHRFALAAFRNRHAVYRIMMLVRAAAQIAEDTGLAEVFMKTVAQCSGGTVTQEEMAPEEELMAPASALKMRCSAGDEVCSAGRGEPCRHVNAAAGNCPFGALRPWAMGQVANDQAPRGGSAS